jgi:hypothetical protein
VYLQYLYGNTIYILLFEQKNIFQDIRFYFRVFSLLNVQLNSIYFETRETKVILRTFCTTKQNRVKKARLFCVLILNWLDPHSLLIIQTITSPAAQREENTKRDGREVAKMTVLANWEDGGWTNSNVVTTKSLGLSRCIVIFNVRVCGQ